MRGEGATLATMTRLLLLLLPCSLALPTDLPIRQSKAADDNLSRGKRSEGEGQETGQAQVSFGDLIGSPDGEDQATADAILSINYRDKQGNLKTLRGRTQELRIRKGKKQGARTGELNAGQIAALMRKLNNRGKRSRSISMIEYVIIMMQQVTSITCIFPRSPGRVTEGQEDPGQVGGSDPCGSSGTSSRACGGYGGGLRLRVLR